MSLSVSTNHCLHTLGTQVSRQMTKGALAQTTGQRDLTNRQVNLAIAMNSSFGVHKTQGALQNIASGGELLKDVSLNLRTALGMLHGATQSAMTLLNGVVTGDQKSTAVSHLIHTLGTMPSAAMRAEMQAIAQLRHQFKTLDFMPSAPGATNVTGMKKTPVVPPNTLSNFIKYRNGVVPAGSVTNISVDPFQYYTLDPSYFKVHVEADFGPERLEANLDTYHGGGIEFVNLISPRSSETRWVKHLTLWKADNHSGLTDADALKGALESFFAAGFTFTVHTDKTNGCVDFKAGPGSHLGVGKFTMTYDGSHVMFRSESGDRIFQVLLDEKILEDAAATSQQKQKPEPVEIPNMGTLYIDHHFQSGKSGFPGDFSFETEPLLSQPRPLVTRAQGEGSVMKTLRQGGERFLYGNLITTRFSEIANQNSNGLVDFRVAPGSHMGVGSFTLGYDGQYVYVADAFGEELIAQKPLPEANLVAAASLSQTQGGAPVPVELKGLGTLYVDPTFRVGQGEKLYIFETQADPFEIDLMVSGREGTRKIGMPRFAVPAGLWGNDSSIERERLEWDPAYQQEIKARLDFASAHVGKAIQDVELVLQALSEDAAAQVGQLEALRNIHDVVSGADLVESAYAVHEGSDRYMNLLASVLVMAQVSAKEQTEMHALPFSAVQRYL